MRLFSIFLTVLLLGCGVAVAGAADDYVQTAVWGGWGPEDGHFNDPFGVAVDGDGYVYVADTYNHRVQKFNSTGGFITKWGGPGSINGTFQFADDIAVDGDGFVYVADRMNHRIQKFTSTGTFETAWGTAGPGDSHFEMLSSVAASSGGDVYAVDRSAKVVKRFTSDGTFVTQWGSNGTGESEFIWPYGVAVDPSGNVWVVDELNPCVQVFTPDGTFVAKWGSNGSAPGELNRPRRISVTDHVFIADSFNVRVQEFTLDGEFVTALGAPGSATNPFQFPVDVAPDGHGSIYVADAGMMDSDVIKKFTRVKAPPVANFSADPPGGQAPLTVQFTDTSTGEVTNRTWDFGDGTSSSDPNPVHTYTAPGSYTVNLTVANAGGSDSETATIYAQTPLVGIRVYTNGQDADAPPGPSIPVGSTVTWTYVVTNTGWGAPCYISVTDDRIGPIPDPAQNELLPYGESRNLSATGTAVAGQYANNATVEAWVPAAGGSGTASDLSHYYGVVPPAVLAVPPSTALPTDPNGDGKYEDVNGNGRPDFADVVLYFNQMTWIAANEPVPPFDYNGNGRIDFADVVWLFNRL